MLIFMAYYARLCLKILKNLLSTSVIYVLTSFRLWRIIEDSWAVGRYHPKQYNKLKDRKHG